MIQKSGIIYSLRKGVYKMNKKILIISAVLIIVIGVGVLGSNMVSAGNNNSHSTLVQKLTEKFDLNESQVQAVFDEVKEERHEDMEEKKDAHFEKLVSEGTITDEQKTLLIEKFGQLKEEKKSNWEDYKNLSFEERKNLKMDHKEDLEKWAEENGIDIQDLFVGFGQKGHHYKGF